MGLRTVQLWMDPLNTTGTMMNVTIDTIISVRRGRCLKIIFIFHNLHHKSPALIEITNFTKVNITSVKYLYVVLRWQQMSQDLTKMRKSMSILSVGKVEYPITVKMILLGMYTCQQRRCG